MDDLINGGSGSGGTNVLHQLSDVDKIYLYVKNPFESKYQLLISGREKVEIKHEKNPKVFIDYSQIIDDVSVNLKDYNPTKKRKVLIVVNLHMIADMEANKNLSPIVTELFIRDKKNSTFYLLLYHNLISKWL